MSTISRFPREHQATKGVEGFSMLRVWNALGKVSQGRQVSEGDRVLVCRWFGLKDGEFITPELAAHLSRQASQSKLRFPREN